MTIIRPVVRGVLRSAIRSPFEDRFGGPPPLPAWVTVGNLFSQPTDINNAAWTKERGSVTNNAIPGPYAASLADLFTEDSTTNTHQARQSITYNASTTYLMRAVVKGNGRDLTLFFSSTTHGTTQQAYYNASTGEISIASGSPTCTATPLGDGWWLFTIQAAATALGAPTAANTIVRLAQYPATQSYLGNGAAGVYAAAVGLHVVS